MLDRIDISPVSQRSPVGFHIMFIAGPVFLKGTLAHDRLADNQGGAVFLLLGSSQSLPDLLHDVPSPRLVFHLSILVHDNATLSRELDIVGIIEHDQVVQSEVACDTTNAL